MCKLTSRTPADRSVRLLLLVLIPLLSSACGGGDLDPGDLSPAELLDRAADRMEGEDTFAFLLEHENGSTSIVRGLMMERAEGRVAGPGRMQAELRARAGPVNVNLGVILLPEGSWITNPLTGQWEVEPINISQFFDPGTGIVQIMRQLTDPVLVGRESVGGVSTHRIEATVASEELLPLVPEAMRGRSLAVRTWVGVDDPRVHRVEIVGPLEPGDADTLVRRLTLSDFGRDFVVEPPRP